MAQTMNQGKTGQTHKFEPVFDKNSKLLILGTFPSVKSREQNFYYGHPQNRFWRVISSIFNEPVPTTIEEKKRLLLRNRVAVWDVIASCDIIGSSDTSITNVVPVEIERVLDSCRIERVFANGNKAKELYIRYLQEKTAMEITGLPSTSPANAGYSLEKLIEHWRVIKDI